MWNYMWQRMEKNKIDSEFLITTIKKYDSIWNKNSKEYCKKSAKESAWTQVCEELFDNWDNLTLDEKMGKQFELKKRWNNIRDYYKKDLALQLNGSIGQPSMKRKKYVFSNKLNFLRPVFDSNFENTETIEEDEDNDDGLEEMEIYVEETVDESESETSFSTKRKNPFKIEEAVDGSESETSFSKKRKNPFRTVEDKKIIEITPLQPKTPEFNDTDYDLLFLQSLLPDMKTMNKKQKIDFKLGVLELYRNIMSENLDCEYEAVEDTKNPLK